MTSQPLAARLAALPGLSLLDPAALTRLHGLELLARGPVEGFVSGRHRSPYRGFSAEFAGHREYAPGDDVRQLDWRVYGRSDRYTVKQHTQETNLRATILLDASGSMAYRGDQAASHAGRPLSKFEYARCLAAALTHVLSGQQDAVGLVTFDTQVRRYLPSRSRPTHLRALLDELGATEPGGETALAPILHEVADRIHRRGLVAIVSDLFDDPTRLLGALRHFRYRKHEALVLHVMAEEELSFLFDRWSRFQDLERRDLRVDADPRALRSTYLDEVRRNLAALKKGCGELRIDYVPFSTRQPFDQALAAYLAHRRTRTK